MPSKSLFDDLAIVLVSTRNPLNIGAAARAMSNFGFSDLRVVNPYELAFREAKSAVGARGLLRRAKLFSSVADAVADCTLVVGTTSARDRKLDHPLRTVQDGVSLIGRKRYGGKVALLFGSEKRGLSNEDFSFCNWLIRIPTKPEQPSMNLGQAVAVCLYDLARVRKRAAVGDRISAGAADLERVTQLLYESLVTSGYAKSKEEEKVVRRLVRSLRLSGDDARRLLGMLRQILWKMKHP
ncbi:MAG TPA: TrmJ/YjtD family RNA methyltransferase [Terriglobales bacterium]|nr:TrmJ/YjtD family RNA methyltransferase [Terriglobales bacterium]